MPQERWRLSAKWRDCSKKMVQIWTNRCGQVAGADGLWIMDDCHHWD